MVVLGIDPGTRQTGFAVVEASGGEAFVIESGAISASAKYAFHQRLRIIYDGLAGLVARYNPDEIAVEDVFVKKNARVALKIGHIRGVALLVAARHEIPIGEYSPGAVKQAIVGSGCASKEQVKFMVTALLKLADVPGEDEADALAVALCHIHRRRLSEDSPIDILRKRYSC
jgi:crossover junction endodeoxyribonuclease RuvC